jgi:alkaline phosphatase D
MRHTRRSVLTGAAGLGIAAVLRSGVARSSSAAGFALGVASGDPWPDSVVLWTRLVRDPLAPDGDTGSESIEVEWQVARDERMADVVRTGVTLAMPELAHSLHVEVGGLESGRPYWYRFRSRGVESPIGRTRTAPAPGSAVPALRFAAAACQHWMYGHWSAYRGMVADDLDFVLHLGDYIYEVPSTSPAAVKQQVRDVPFGVPKTLAEYRRMHALYRTDPAIQAAHQAFPWIVIWDDHDVENDYAADEAPGRPARAAFLQQRAAAYQAYWEHMPLRAAQRPVGPDALLHRRLAFGDLIDLVMLDERQYRSPLACAPAPPARHSNRTVTLQACPEIRDGGRSMLGAAQEQWLAQCLAEPARARWLVLGQQLLFAPFAFTTKDGPGFSTDGWGGYGAGHQRLLDLIAARRNGDTLVIGGDQHAFIASDIPARIDDAGSKAVATHVVCGPISSRLGDHDRYVAGLPANPHVKLVDARRHGFTRCTVERDSATFTFRAVDDVRDPDSKLGTLANFTTPRGTPGLRSA